MPIQFEERATALRTYSSIRRPDRPIHSRNPDLPPRPMGGPREFDSDRFALPLRAHREAIQEIPRPRECVSGADGFAEFGQFELVDPRAHLLLPEDFIAFLEKLDEQSSQRAETDLGKSRVKRATKSAPESLGGKKMLIPIRRQNISTFQSRRSQTGASREAGLRSTNTDVRSFMNAKCLTRGSRRIVAIPHRIPVRN